MFASGQNDTNHTSYKSIIRVYSHSIGFRPNPLLRSSNRFANLAN